MNKNFLLITTIFIVVMGYIFNVDKTIKNNLSIISDKISNIYLDGLISIESTVTKYFNQIDYIEQLKKENKEFTKYKILYDTTYNELKELKNIFEIKQEQPFELEKVKVISYHTIYDPSIVNLDTVNDINTSIIPLITYEGYSAGIVIKKENRYLGYLNKNLKCNYAVFVGEEDAPGITSGVNNEGDLVINFIPKWKQVKIDDEIITSNMDNIFPYGIKVGKVTKIVENENTKSVYAKPYGDTLGKRFFYIIKNLETKTALKDTNSTK